MVSCHRELNVVSDFAVLYEIIRNTSFFIITDVAETIVEIFRRTICDHVAVQSFVYFRIILDVAVDDQCAVRRQ